MSGVVHRVVILGGGGTGKTTLAAALSSTLGVPMFELDGGADADEVAAGETWVAEGIFLYGITPLLDRADRIVWLDLPRRIALWRIAIRHARRSLRRDNPHKGLRLLVRFLRDQSDYYRRPARVPTSASDWAALSRASTERLLDDYKHKVIRLPDPVSVTAFLTNVRR